MVTCQRCLDATKARWMSSELNPKKDSGMAPLKVCPLCSEPAAHQGETVAWDDDCGGKWHVVCTGCGCSVESPDGTKEGAATRWNARPRELVLKDTLRYARGLLKDYEEDASGEAFNSVRINEAIDSE